MAPKPRDLFNKKNVQDVNQEIAFMEEKLIAIADNLSNAIKNAFEEIHDESRGVAEVVGNQLNKHIKNVAKGLQKTLQNTQKLYQGTLKVADVQEQIEDSNFKILALERDKTQLKLAGIKLTKEQLAEIDEVIKEEKKNIKLKQAQLDLAKDMQKRMGLTGKIIEGISKIPLVGGLVDAKEATKEMQKAAAGGASQFKVMLVGIKAVGKSIGESLTDPLTLITGYTSLFVKGIRAVTGLIFGLIGQSAKIGQNFLNFAGSTDQVQSNILKQVEGVRGLNLNFDEAMAHMKAINDLTGTAVQLTTEQVDEMQRLTNGLGMSQEQAAKLFKISQLTGQSFTDIANTTHDQVNEMNALNTLVLSANDVFEKMTNITGQAKSNLESQGISLAEAAFQASKLGLELSAIQAAAEQTLDFESSIEKEMKAELLLGKSLNLENLRSAALRGDVLTQGKEIEKIIKQNIDSTKGNVVAQRALAETLGLSVEEMFKINDEMIMQKQLGEDTAVTLEEYNEKRLKKQKELTKELGRQVTLEEAGAALSDKELNSLNDRANKAQLFQRLLETAKETFMSAFVGTEKDGKGGPLQNVIDGLNDFIKGDGLSKAVALIRNVGGFVGKMVSYAVENPKTFALKLAGAFMIPLGALLLSQKLVPQLVMMAGPFFSKMSKLFKGGFKGLKTAFLGKKVGGQFMKGGGRYAAGARSGGLMGKIGGAGAKIASKSKGIFGKIGTGLKNFGGGIASKFGKGGLKGLGKSLLKKIPGVGLLAGVGFGIKRALSGDFAGAAMELGSGLASTIPGVGTALSVGLDGALLARDMNNSASMSGDTAADFISRPGQPIQKFRADDVVVGGTNLGGAGGGNVEQLLRQILTAIESGGDVFMDGDKVGKSLVLATSRMG